MRRLIIFGLITLAGLTVLGFAAASAGRAPSPVDPQAVTVDADTATRIATSAFAAFETGDYDGWSRDWSEAMRSAITEEAFHGWRASVVEQLGGFESLGTPELSSRQPGTYRWSFPVTFERGTATIGFGFAEGADEVQGVFVE